MVLGRMLVLAVTLLPALCHASDGAGEQTLTWEVANLVFQLGVILIASRIGGKLLERTSIPSVLGELFVGLLIGPFLLGGIPLPAFPHGLFPLAEGAAVPVSPMLYSIATIASILLLFMSGLETDLTLLLRFSVAGIVVGMGGVILSLAGGIAAGALLLHYPPLSPPALFLGILSTATSVGITARILSDLRKMDSPEGVTILASAVIDDVLGIILLAVVTSFTAGGAHPDISAELRHILVVVVKTVALWLGFTSIGLLSARYLASFLKTFRSVTAYSVLAFGLALIVAGIFEKAGIAMIIGAYVMGLSLSRTDLSYVIQEALRPLYSFFVPVFFVVMGMLVNLREVLAPDVLVFGGIFTLVAIAAKVVGCGIPALFVKFTPIGALRIGLGMVPRGEVALIIASIGLAAGVLDHRIFGAAVLMTLLTTLLPPPLLNALLRSPRKGSRREFKMDRVTTPFDFGSHELSDLLTTKVNQYFRSEGFYVQPVQLANPVFQIRREDIFITLTSLPDSLVFESDTDDVAYVKAVVYESLLQLNDTITKVKEALKPDSLRLDISDVREAHRLDVRQALDARCIVPRLRARDKESVLRELIDILDRNGHLRSKRETLLAVLERERSMSTGMQHGIAIPHAKTDAVSEITVAIGLSDAGIDFQSIDGEPSRIFVMVISPLNTTGPHIQFLAALAALLNSEEARAELLAGKSRDEIYWFFRNGLLR